MRWCRAMDNPELSKEGYATYVGTGELVSASLLSPRTRKVRHYLNTR